MTSARTLLLGFIAFDYDQKICFSCSDVLFCLFAVVRAATYPGRIQAECGTGKSPYRREKLANGTGLFL